MLIVATPSGLRLDLFNPQPELIQIEDVAAGLSRARVYPDKGAFYSWAQHAVHVSRFCPRGLALQGLMLHAAKAYPIPESVSPADRSRIYTALARATCDRFKLPHQEPEEFVRHAERVVKETEKRDILNSAPRTNAAPRRLTEIIQPFKETRAYEYFLDRYCHVASSPRVVDDRFADAQRVSGAAR